VSESVRLSCSNIYIEREIESTTFDGKTYTDGEIFVFLKKLLSVYLYTVSESVRLSCSNIYIEREIESTTFDDKTYTDGEIFFFEKLKLLSQPF